MGKQTSSSPKQREEVESFVWWKTKNRKVLLCLLTTCLEINWRAKTRSIPFKKARARNNEAIYFFTIFQLSRSIFAFAVAVDWTVELIHGALCCARGAGVRYVVPHYATQRFRERTRWRSDEIQAFESLKNSKVDNVQAFLLCLCISSLFDGFP